MPRPNSLNDQSEPFGLGSKRHFVGVKAVLRQRRGGYFVMAAKSNIVTFVTFLIPNMHILLREGDFDTVRIQRVVNGAEHLTDD